MNKAKHTFFCSDIDLGNLSEEESKHAVRVLRLDSGAHIHLIDGKGRRTLAEIIVPDKNRLLFKIIEDYKEIGDDRIIHIAIAPTKSMDRFSFFIEKVTEIGIQKITPLICSNSERQQLNIEKLRKNLISAVKQSGNLYIPHIDEPLKFSDFIESLDDDSDNYIAHCEEDQKKTELKNITNSKNKIVILIGPEGDFSSEEINLAVAKGIKPISLGNNRLRTETAGIVACHTLHVIS